MASKTQQLQKLMKIRATLVKFKLAVKNVNPILENLLKKDKPPLDAKLLREIENILQVREYLKKSRLQTTETDREINEFLENLHEAFMSGTPAPLPELHTKEHPKKATEREPNSKKRPAATPSSDTPAPPPELHTKKYPTKSSQELNPKKRVATTAPSSEPQAKKPRPEAGPRTAKNPLSPGGSSTQPITATVSPWPLKTAAIGGSLFMIADANCSPVIDIDSHDHSFRVYDQNAWPLNQRSVFRFSAMKITKMLYFRPSKQICIKITGAEVDLQFVWVKYLDQVVSAIEQKGDKLKAEHSPCGRLPRPNPDDSEADSFSRVKKETVPYKDEGNERPKRNTNMRNHTYEESNSEDSSDDDYVTDRD